MFRVLSAAAFGVGLASAMDMDVREPFQSVVTNLDDTRLQTRLFGAPPTRLLGGFAGYGGMTGDNGKGTKVLDRLKVPRKSRRKSRRKSKSSPVGTADDTIPSYGPGDTIINISGWDLNSELIRYKQIKDVEDVEWADEQLTGEYKEGIPVKRTALYEVHEDYRFDRVSERRVIKLVTFSAYMTKHCKETGGRKRQDTKDRFALCKLVEFRGGKLRFSDRAPISIPEKRLFPMRCRQKDNEPYFIDYCFTGHKGETLSLLES